MPWPTMSDYQDALQNPRFSFSDAELARGVPVTDRLGLPKPVTGGFASVYQVNCDGRKWAVRCFLHYHQDIEQRYAAIGRFLQSAKLPYTAGFQFLGRGVRVQGQWYPVLKMEWVEGEPLNAYVERNRADGPAMRRLAEQFARMTRDLRQAGIAHGDLQHGNVMVVGGNLRLVDYDGMFVPTLRGMPSHELGHPNYQHPRRSDRDFGPYLDNFSEWVIHLSLLALSIQPGLWEVAGAGDEQLLFSQKDFTDPRASSVLRALSETRDDTLRQLGTTFRSILACQDISQIPAIDGTRMPAPVPSERYVVVGANQPPAAGAARNGSVPDWVWDHMEAGQVQMGPPFVVERVAVASWGGLSIALARFAALHYLAPVTAAWISMAGVVAVAIAVVFRYRGRPEYVRKAALMVQAGAARREIRRVENAMKQVERERDRLSQREDRSRGNITARIQDVARQQKEEEDQVDAWLQRFLVGLIAKRDEMTRAEADELAKAAKSTPLLSLGSRAAAIMKYYRGKRDPLLRQEERAKVEAAKKKDSVRQKYQKRQDPWNRKLEELKLAFKKDRDFLDERYEQETQKLTLQKWSLQNLSREQVLYERVTLVAFLRKVFFIKG